MKSTKFKITTLLMSILIMGSSITANAHSGRTDANGGHKDNKNVSGLGPYHYHHGYGPHLHDNGCPYDAKPTKNNSPSNSPSNSNKNTTNSTSNKKNNDSELKAKKAEEEKIEKEKEEKEAVKKNGFTNGFNDGYAKKDDISSKYNKKYKEEYIKSYKDGFKKGEDKINSEIEIEKNYGFKDGSSGVKSEKNYKNELLISAYNEGYEEGYKIYKDKMIAEFKEKGEDDALNENKPMEFDEINQEFKDAYTNAYNSKKAEIDAEKENDSLALIGGIVILGAAGAGTVVYKKKKAKK